MEASKCPKCGDEPFFIEHVEKWYCYGCNSYIDEEQKHECPAEAEQAIEPVLEVTPRAVAEPVPEPVKVEVREEPPAKTPIAEELSALEKEPLANESQSLIDTAGPASRDGMPAPVLDGKLEELDIPLIVIHNDEAPGPKPEVVEVKVKMCSSCGHPLKFIEKYQRYYCYGCRKYAPKEQLVKDDPESKVCPECGKGLKFIEKYSEWYCYSCKAYPLRTKKIEPAKPKVDGCPKCGEPLKFVEKYQRHYCYKCKEYAPASRGSPGVQEPAKPKEGKTCPACKGDMKYIAEYNEWYCFKCKKYALRPSKPVLLL